MSNRNAYGLHDWLRDDLSIQFATIHAGTPEPGMIEWESPDADVVQAIEDGIVKNMGVRDE